MISEHYSYSITSTRTYEPAFSKRSSENIAPVHRITTHLLTFGVFIHEDRTSRAFPNGRNGKLCSRDLVMQYQTQPSHALVAGYYKKMLLVTSQWTARCDVASPVSVRLLAYVLVSLVGWRCSPGNYVSPPRCKRLSRGDQGHATRSNKQSNTLSNLDNINAVI